MQDDLFIVAYDIRDDRRLRRMRRLLARHFHHAQRSVFECQLGQAGLNALLADAESVMAANEDSLCLVRIDRPENGLQIGGPHWTVDPYFTYLG